MIDPRTVDEIVRRIAEGYDPDKVIIFGSVAKGTEHEDSDIDLLILKNDTRKPVERNREVRRLLFGIKYPIDVFVKTTEEFDRFRDVVGSMFYDASREGRVIYERR